MAARPSETLPVGTGKKRQLQYYEEKIDAKIRCSEGETVAVDIWHLGNSFFAYANEIISLYKDAGWKYVYLDEVSFDNGTKLVLTNNWLVVDKWFYKLEERKQPKLWGFVKWVITFQFIRTK